MKAHVRDEIVHVLQADIPDVPDNAVLYIHNEPDLYRYSFEQIDDIHDRVNKLL